MSQQNIPHAKKDTWSPITQGFYEGGCGNFLAPSRPKNFTIKTWRHLKGIPIMAKWEFIFNLHLGFPQKYWVPHTLFSLTKTQLKNYLTRQLNPPMPGDLAKANSLRKARSTFACASASSAVVAGVSDMPWWVGGGKLRHLEIPWRRSWGTDEQFSGGLFFL